ncbi:MAG: hypothetical protein JW870_20725 [Candidatus Delongbacteria bacterium]|nr:hypothetical protein [Candidatus Delongbacteria bacterium]
MEGNLIKDVYWATPFYRGEGRGLSIRSEAHFTHIVSNSLENLGFICLLEDPYCFKCHWKEIYSRKSRKDETLPRCDIKAILNPSDYPSANVNILHMEIKILKYFWRFPGILKGMLKDILKLKEALTESTSDGRIIAGFLLIAFDRRASNQSLEIQNKLQQFINKAKIQKWVYNYKYMCIPSSIPKL